MLLLLASVLGDKIGVFLLLFAHLQRKNHKSEFISNLRVAQVTRFGRTPPNLVELFLNLALLLSDQL